MKKLWKILHIFKLANSLGQCFPTFLISRSHSKILHERLAPAITCNSKDVEIKTNKIKNTVISHLRFAVIHAYAKQTAPMLNSGTTELASVQLVLKFLMTCLWELLSCHSQRPLHFLVFCVFCFIVDKDWIPSLADKGEYYKLGVWGKLSERYPKTVVEGVPSAHLHIILALLWKSYDLLQILLNVTLDSSSTF